MTLTELLDKRGEKRGIEVGEKRGIEVGEQVVIVGQLRLAPGSPVEIKGGSTPGGTPAGTAPKAGSTGGGL